MPSENPPVVLAQLEITVNLFSSLPAKQILPGLPEKDPGESRKEKRRKKAGEEKGDLSSKEKVYSFERILSEDGRELGVRFRVPQ